jgi:hypothetical protein
MIPEEESKSNVETISLNREQLDSFDENERPIVADGEDNDQRTYGNAADLHAKSWQAINRLSRRSGSLLQLSIDLAHRPRDGLAFAFLPGPPMKLPQ